MGRGIVARLSAMCVLVLTTKSQSTKVPDPILMDPLGTNDKCGNVSCSNAIGRTDMKWSAFLAESARELRPERLTDPDVNLSIHPARAIARRLPPSIDYRVPPVAG